MWLVACKALRAESCASNLWSIMRVSRRLGARIIFRRTPALLRRWPTTSGTDHAGAVENEPQTERSEHEARNPVDRSFVPQIDPARLAG